MKAEIKKSEFNLNAIANKMRKENETFISECANAISALVIGIFIYVMFQNNYFSYFLNLFFGK